MAQRSARGGEEGLDSELEPSLWSGELEGAARSWRGKREESGTVAHWRMTSCDDMLV